MTGSWQSCLAAIDLDLVDLDSEPDPWTDFLAWPRTCLITVDLSGDLDSCLSLLTVAGPAPFASLKCCGTGPLSVRQLPLLASLSCWTAGHPPLESSTCLWCSLTQMSFIRNTELYLNQGKIQAESCRQDTQMRSLSHIYSIELYLTVHLYQLLKGHTQGQICCLFKHQGQAQWVVWCWYLCCV